MASIFKDLMAEGFYNFNAQHPRGLKIKHGFMVSFKDCHIIPVCNDDEGNRVLDLIVSRNIFELFRKWGKDPQKFVGIWEHDGFYHIDWSMQVMNKEVAIALGKHYKQLAIWDCENGVEIIL